VWTASLEPENELVEQAGARYASTHDSELSELGKFDLVIEAAGNAQLMAQTLSLLRRSGIACLLGIDPRVQTVELDGRVLGVDTILENRVLFGSVNAHRQDWLAAVARQAAHADGTYPCLALERGEPAEEEREERVEALALDSVLAHLLRQLSRRARVAPRCGVRLPPCVQTRVRCRAVHGGGRDE